MQQKYDDDDDMARLKWPTSEHDRKLHKSEN